MKRLIAVAALALGGSGCGFIWDTGSVAATWSITIDGQAATCDAVGGHTVVVTSRRVHGGSTKVDLFDCVDLGGVTAEMRTGLYDVTVQLLNRDGEELSDEITVEVRVPSDDAVNAGHFEFAFAGDEQPQQPSGQGWFKLSWVITENGLPSTCSVVDATTVEVLLELGGTPGSKSFKFPCTDMTGTTDNVPVGTYEITIRLLNKDDVMLNTAPVKVNLPLVSSETKNVGDFEFAFTRTPAP